MKHLLIGISAAATLLATGALAADLPMKAPVYKAPEPVFNWTGFYVGGNLGYGAGNEANSATVDQFLTGLPLPGVLNGTNSARNAVDGMIGGGQIGYNWQMANWLLGLEADIQYSDQRHGSSAVTCLACSDDGSNIVTTLNQSLDWFGTARGRAGFLVSPELLFYATGGLAYGNVNVTGSASGNFNAATTVLLPGNSSTRVGWTVGAGTEWHLAGNWTAKFEYLYMDLGTINGGPVPLTGILVPVRTEAGLSYSSHFTDNIVRVGVNYHFNGPMGAPF